MFLFFALVARKPRAKLQTSLATAQNLCKPFTLSCYLLTALFYIISISGTPTSFLLCSQCCACSMLGTVVGWTHSNLTPLKILINNFSPLGATIELSSHMHWEILAVLRFREGSGGLFSLGFCHQNVSSLSTPWVTQSFLWLLSCHLFCHSVPHRAFWVPHALSSRTWKLL